MKYKNITDRPRNVVCSSVKQLIQPGGVVNLSKTDIRHAGGAMRFFESIYKAQEIADDLFRRSVSSRGGSIDELASAVETLPLKEGAVKPAAVEGPKVIIEPEDIEDSPEAVDEPDVEEPDVIEDTEPYPEVGGSATIEDEAIEERESTEKKVDVDDYSMTNSGVKEGR